MKHYLLFPALLLTVQLCFSQNNNAPDNELKDKYHQFDFWLGEWDVYKFDTDTVVGQSNIESIIDSVGILENYSSGRYKGKSLNKYNPVTKKWEQFWVDNSGLTLNLSGGLVKNEMILRNREVKGEKIIRNKVTWTPIEADKVRQVWEISQDDGKTWKKAFDGLYVRK